MATPSYILKEVGGEERIYHLSEGSNTMGRDEGNLIVLDDRWTSSTHCEVAIKSGTVVVRDLGSTNGTFVNDTLIKEQVLREGDELKLGSCCYVLGRKKKAGADKLVDSTTITTACKRNEDSQLSDSTILHFQDASSSFAPEGSQAVRAVFNLSALFDAGNAINSCRDVRGIAEKTVATIFKVLPARRGALVMLKPGSDELMPVVCKERGQSGGNAHLELSRTIMAKVIKENQSVLSQDTTSDDRFAGGQSIASLKIRSFICVPLKSHTRTRGFIYVDADRANAFGKDELLLISALGNQAGIAIENVMLYQENLEKGRLQEEMNVARRIQKKLMPAAPPGIPGYEVFGWSFSCTETGGDYYDYLTFKGNRPGLVIGDVSGHGVGAALIMATARSALRSIIFEEPDLARIMKLLNGVLERDVEEDHFMTMLLLQLEADTGKVTYVNAGHDAPLVYRQATGTVEELETGGFPLGMMADSQYQQKTLPPLAEGDLLLLLTDGVWEARSSRTREPFGRKALQELLQRHHHLGSRLLVRKCYREVREFSGAPGLDDDFTMVVLRRGEGSDSSGEETEADIFETISEKDRGLNQKKISPRENKEEP